MYFTLTYKEWGLHLQKIAVLIHLNCEISSIGNVVLVTKLISWWQNYFSSKQIISHIRRQHWHDLITMVIYNSTMIVQNFLFSIFSLNKRRNWRNSSENPSYNRRHIFRIQFYVHTTEYYFFRSYVGFRNLEFQLTETRLINIRKFHHYRFLDV